MVNNFNMLNQLSGCNVINGSLEISMKGGSKYALITRDSCQKIVTEDRIVKCFIC